MKLQKTHIYTLKLHSSLLDGYDWNYTTTIEELRKDACAIVSLNDSQVLRWLAKINGTENSDQVAKEIKSEIKRLKREPTTKNNKKAIAEKYKQLYKTRFTSDYMMVVFDKKSHYDRARKGFSITIDGVTTKYRRFIGTANSIKKNTIIFVNIKVYDKLMWHMNNGRDMNKPAVPAKLEAYMSLACSGSIPLKEFPRIMVVDDCITHSIIPEMLHLNYTDMSLDEPVIELRKNQEIEINGSDGFGLMTPEFSKRVNAQLGGDPEQCVTFNSRCAFTKGMLVPFDFVDFAEKKAHGKYVVKDAWGNLQDVREHDVILTVSMLKLWDSYSSCEDYVKKCREHGFDFCVAKTAPHELDSQQTSNYQFLQDFINLTDEDIDELIEPTVSHIKNALGLDWRKLLLYMCGKGLDEKTYKYAEPIARAIMICPEIVKDKYIRSRIEKMIAKSIKDAKIGVLQLHGNFQIITGDPYCLAESIFGLPKIGLLKSGEAYSKYWIDRNVDKITAFRAPMIVQNNVAQLNIVRNSEIDYWYQYINSTIVLNNFSDICIRECGCDFDADTFMTTDNPVLLRRYRHLPAIDCVSVKPEKKIPTENDFVISEKRGFNDQIGSITNKGTGQKSMQSAYEIGSVEYEELGKRAICCVQLQQSEIDAVKGAWSRPAPKHWFDYKSNLVKDGDDNETIQRKLMNQKLVAKNPFFFIFNYEYLYKEYTKYMKNVDANSQLRFGKTLPELLDSTLLSNDEQEFIDNYYKYLPVDCSPGVINRICWKIEDIFKSKDVLPGANFDYHILTSDAIYSKAEFNAIEELYAEYIRTIRNIKKQYAQKSNDVADNDMVADLFVAKETWKEKCLSVCNNEKVLTNILLEVCYNSNNSKSMVWDVCGEQIVKNLLEKNNNMLHFPKRCVDGDIEFDGEMFAISEVIADEEVDI